MKLQKNGSGKSRLSLKNDFLFKRMFGEEESKPLLIGLLNAILGRSGERRIADLTVLGSKRLTRKLINDKEGVLDIHCETGDRELFNIEMQVREYPDMEKRSMFYVGKLFVNSLRKGQEYAELKKTIGINLLDYALFPLVPFHHTFHLFEDINKHYMLTDLWELHFIEIEKFRQVAFDPGLPLHRWLRYIDGRLNEEQRKELIRMDPLIEAAEERLNELSLDEETRLFYEAREKGIMTTRSMINAAHKKGKDEGRDEGRNEGRDEGRDEGRQEAVTEVALNMLRAGIDFSTILLCTGLTEEQLGKLSTEQ